MRISDPDWRARLRLGVTRGRAWANDYVYAAHRQLRGPFEWRTAHRFASGERAPVVLLAGVVEPWTMLLPVAERLHQAGHPVLVVPELALNLASVRDAAALARAAIIERDLHKVILVAHSKGGLVGKRLLIDDTEGRIAALIAIATPFHGSSLARLLPTPAISALRPDDPVIQELTSSAHVNSRITSIYPAFDPHVPESSRLEGATNIELAVMGHFRLLRDPELLDAVVAAAERVE
jgi:pimeloyl-ACP methyl ester carboxylesterase